MRYLTLILLLSISILKVSAQSTMEAVRDVVENGYNFWIYTPQSYYHEIETTTISIDDSIAFEQRYGVVPVDTVNPKPLVIFLHGASLCGYDLNRVRRYGCLDAVKRGVNIDAVILAPQNPGGAWSPSKLMNIVDWVKENYSIDTSRVYVLGMSLGGYGTMDLAGTYPEKITAAIAMCGGSTLSNVNGLGKLPLWIIHGTADRAVPIKYSQDVVEKLEAENNDTLLMYNWLTGASHSALARLFYIDKTYDWLFSHSLEDSSRYVNRDFDVSMNDIKNAYSHLKKDLNSFAVVDTASSKTISDLIAKEFVNCSTYTIKQGDTLIGISKKTRTSVSTLCALNNMSKSSVLRIGKKLRIKAGK